MSTKYLSYVILVMLLFSCNTPRNGAYRHEINAYVISTRFTNLDMYFISLPINVGRVGINGPEIQGESGHVVVLGNTLYKKLFKQKYSLYDFSNYILSLLVRHEELYVTNEQFQALKPYIISKEDGDHYISMTSREILGIKIKTGYFLDPDATSPGYRTRCIIHNLVANGYFVNIEHDSGFLYYQRVNW